MPKFFVTSDIHSYYTELITALNNAGFDANNEDHYLVVCGDYFDRGTQSKEMYEYLMSLERKVLVKGNHDDMMVDMLRRGYPKSHDQHNGTKDTLYQLASTVNTSRPISQCSSFDGSNPASSKADFISSKYECVSDITNNFIITILCYNFILY